MTTRTAQRTAQRTRTFTESVIREMTRVAREHDAVNLAQGFPDFPAPELLKEAACAAIRADINQYAITWGAPSLRHALAKKYADAYDMEVDTEREITVTCGGTEAMASVMMAIVANRMVGAVGSVIVGVLFALVFHLVNFVLGVFSPTIHALRLHYVEFFGKFYRPGGADYAPLRHWQPNVPNGSPN